MTPGSEKLFNTIAPVYSLFFGFQERNYRRILDQVNPLYDFSGYKSVIDVGCGTGALCSVLHSRGLRVTGVDHSEKMLAEAAKKLTHTDVQLVNAKAHQPMPFPDKSFDMAISAYTAHGMPGSERRKLYLEMDRLAKQKVIYHDFNNNRSLLIDLVERLEGSDYFDFICNARREMATIFKDVTVMDVGRSMAWYICTPY